MPIPLALLAGAAGLSALGKGVEGYFAGQRAEEQSKILADAVRQAMQTQQGAYDETAQMYQPYQQAGTTALGQLVGGDFTTPMGQFQYGQTTADFLDPSMAYQQDQMRRQVESSAAYGGDLMSGATLKELQDRSQQLAAQDWGNAQQRMMQDKQFAYGTFMDQFRARQANNQQRLQQLQGLTNLGASATYQMGANRMQLGANQAGLQQSLGNVQAAGVAPGMGELISGTIGNMANPQNVLSLYGAMGGMGGGAATPSGTGVVAGSQMPQGPTGTMGPGAGYMGMRQGNLP